MQNSDMADVWANSMAIPEGVLPLGEFTVTIPDPHATWQGVIIPSAILKIVFRHILFLQPDIIKVRVKFLCLIDCCQGATPSQWKRAKCEVLELPEPTDVLYKTDNAGTQLIKTPTVCPNRWTKILLFTSASGGQAYKLWLGPTVRRDFYLTY